MNQAELRAAVEAAFARAALVVRREDPFDWYAFLAAADRARAIGAAYPALRLCEDLAPGTVPPDVLHEGMRAMPALVFRVLTGLSPRGRRMWRAARSAKG